MRNNLILMRFRGLTGAPGGDRTHNLQLRRLTLYPIELQAQNAAIVDAGGFEFKEGLAFFVEPVLQTRQTICKQSCWQRGKSSALFSLRPGSA